jgi:RNA polymerase sigma-70 factor (ECF subfamily)
MPEKRTKLNGVETIQADAETDEQLAEACRRLDHQAFRMLMERYMQPILNFIRQYAKSTEEAEDITQDTFFKVWKYIGRYSKGKMFRPWLYTIARNTALDHLKKRRAFTFSELDDDSGDLNFADTLEDTEPLPPKIFEDAALTKKLNEQMELIHPDYRTIITLHYRDELTFDEIGEVLGKPMNTVKSWHRRALIELRKLMAELRTNNN